MTARTRRRWLVVLAFLASPASVQAHPALVRSVPARDATLVAAPVELRLTFNEPVEVALTSVTLEGPGGTVVPVGKVVRSAESAQMLVAPIGSTLANGRYTVKWRVAGKDGHAVRGEFSFIVAIAPKPAESLTMAPEAPFDAASAPYAVVRGVRYTSLLVLIGATAFVLIVLPRVRMPAGGDKPALAAGATRRASVAARWAVVILLISSGARLLAQLTTVGDIAALGQPAMYVTVLTQTTWGYAWILEAAAALVALWALTRVRPTRRWFPVAAAAPLLALASALSGHAVAVPGRTALAVTLDALHVLGASAWIGSLFVLGVAGLPSARALGGDAGEAATRAVVEAFSPTALASAAVLAFSGSVTAWLHLGGLSELWTSPFGRTLLVKLSALALVAAVGAYNGRIVLPALGRPGGGERVWRSTACELAIAAVVVAVTAVLVGMPTPMESTP